MTTKVKNEDLQRRNLVILAGVATAVIVGLIAVVALAGGTGARIDYSAIEQTRFDDGGFVLGDPEAVVTIVAFEDFLCPHCQRYQPTIKAFIEEYVATGRAKFEYRMLPAVDPTFSQLTAQFAECAPEQDVSFWTAHDELFAIASSERFSNSSSRTFASNLGLNYAELLDCASEADQVFTDSSLADQLGVSGTPTVGYRVNNGPIQYAANGGGIPQQPTLDQMATVVNRFSPAGS